MQLPARIGAIQSYVEVGRLAELATSGYALARAADGTLDDGARATLTEGLAQARAVLDTRAPGNLVAPGTTARATVIRLHEALEGVARIGSHEAIANPPARDAADQLHRTISGLERHLYASADPTTAAAHPAWVEAELGALVTTPEPQFGMGQLGRLWGIEQLPPGARPASMPAPLAHSFGDAFLAAAGVGSPATPVTAGSLRAELAHARAAAGLA